LLRPYAKSAEILSHSIYHDTKGFTRLRRVRKDGRGDATFLRRTEMLLKNSLTAEQKEAMKELCDKKDSEWCKTCRKAGMSKSGKKR